VERKLLKKGLTQFSWADRGAAIKWPAGQALQQSITSFFKRATPEQAAERMEADAAMAEEQKAAEAEVAAKMVSVGLPYKYFALMVMDRFGPTVCCKLLIPSWYKTNYVGDCQARPL
jgi:hypothetical protein